MNRHRFFAETILIIMMALWFVIAVSQFVVAFHVKTVTDVLLAILLASAAVLMATWNYRKLRILRGEQSKEMSDD